MEQKEKNVLITGKAYRYLIDELGLNPEDLLAKLPVEKDRIKSPKTNKFIHIGSSTYMKLLADYKKEDLLLRRDGFIHSPDSTNLIRVFGKKFNQLLSKANEDAKYSLENMLKQPRIKRGNDEIGVKYNTEPVKEKINEKVEILKQLKKENDKTPKVVEKFTLNKKKVDELIKTNEPILVFNSANYKQYDEERDKHTNGFFTTAALFREGKLQCFYEAKEYKVGTDEFEYIFQHKVFGETTTVDQYNKYLYEDNDDSLINIKLEDIDLKSMAKFVNKEKIFNIIHKKSTVEGKFYDVVTKHLWFLIHMRLFNLIEAKKHLINIQLEDNYEESIDVINCKEQLIEEIEEYKEKLINYVNENF